MSEGASAVSSVGSTSSGASAPSQTSNSKPAATKQIGTNLSPGNSGAYKAAPTSGGGEQSFTPSDDSADGEGQSQAQDPQTELFKQRVKHKIDGKDVELSVEQLVKDYSLKQASMKRFEEAAQVRKQAEQLIEQLFADPERFLEHEKFKQRGMTKRQIAEQILRKEIEQEMLSPEELKQRDQETELEQLRREKAERDEAKRQEDYQKHKQAAEHKYSTKFQEALTAAKLPKTPFTVKRLAEYQRQALKAGYDLTANELGELVSEEVRGEVKELTGHLDAETLISLFGDDIAKKIRDYDLQKVTGSVGYPGQKQGGALKSQRSAPEKKMSIQEWQEMREKQYGV